MIVVNISSDLTTLGQGATQADLDRYTENLAQRLADRFKQEVEVCQVSGTPREWRTCDVPEIAEYVDELHQSNGWVGLL